uniref:F-box domain-containing protein n=1 Tax=Panagrellus redivivus TaxID=6233 RepID=A0A7E4VDS2_PANRE
MKPLFDPEGDAVVLKPLPTEPILSFPYMRFTDEKNIVYVSKNGRNPCEAWKMDLTTWTTNSVKIDWRLIVNAVSYHSFDFGVFRALYAVPLEIKFFQCTINRDFIERFYQECLKPVKLLCVHLCKVLPDTDISTVCKAFPGVETVYLSKFPLDNWVKKLVKAKVSGLKTLNIYDSFELIVNWERRDMLAFFQAQRINFVLKLDIKTEINYHHAQHIEHVRDLEALLHGDFISVNEQPFCVPCIHFHVRQKSTDMFYMLKETGLPSWWGCFTCCDESDSDSKYDSK